jgi:hypothetical protein
LVEYLEGKRQLGRARRRCKDKIEVGFIEIGWDGMGCIYLAQDLDTRLIPFDTVIYFGVNKMRVIF